MEIQRFSFGSSESHLWISGSVCSKLWIWHFSVWRCHGAPCCCSLEKHNCLCLAVLFPFTQMATLSLLKINIMRNSLAPFHLLDSVSLPELQWKLYEFSSSQLAVLWLSRWPSCYCPTGSNCTGLWCQGMDLMYLGTRGPLHLPSLHNPYKRKKQELQFFVHVVQQISLYLSGHTSLNFPTVGWISDSVLCFYFFFSCLKKELG